MSKTFKDSLNREWVIQFDVPTIERVKSATGETLTDLSDTSPWTKMLTDAVLLVRVLTVVLQPQMETASIEPEDFGRAMVGDQLDSAWTALREAMEVFFPQRSRSLLRALCDFNEQMMDESSAVALRRMSDPTIRKRALTAWQKQMDAKLTELENLP